MPFIDKPDKLQWLRESHLRFHLPQKWAEFGSAVLPPDWENGDAPEWIGLYQSSKPGPDDEYLLIRLYKNGGATLFEHNGIDDKIGRFVASHGQQVDIDGFEEPTNLVGNTLNYKTAEDYHFDTVRDLAGGLPDTTRAFKEREVDGSPEQIQARHSSRRSVHRTRQ